jgi:hypothetical protein
VLTRKIGGYGRGCPGNNAHIDPGFGEGITWLLDFRKFARVLDSFARIRLSQ